MLAKLMELKDQPAHTGEPQRVTAKEMESEPRVAMRHLQTRAGQRNEIITSGVYEHLPVLLAESGELRGQTYCQAQGMLAMAVSPRADGRVQLDLVPSSTMTRAGSTGLATRRCGGWRRGGRNARSTT